MSAIQANYSHCDLALHREVKVEAARRGVSIAALLTTALRQELDAAAKPPAEPMRGGYVDFFNLHSPHLR